MIELRKVAVLENPSDVLTKHLTEERINHYSNLIGYTLIKGRLSPTSGLHSIKSEGFRDVLLTLYCRQTNGPYPVGLLRRQWFSK